MNVFLKRFYILLQLNFELSIFLNNISKIKYLEKVLNDFDNSINISENSAKENMEVDYVIKRDGRREEMEFDKISKRIKTLSEGLKVNSSRVTQKVCSMIYPDINTSEMDELAGQVCSS